MKNKRTSKNLDSRTEKKKRTKKKRKLSFDGGDLASHDAGDDSPSNERRFVTEVDPNRPRSTTEIMQTEESLPDNNDDGIDPLTGKPVEEPKKRHFSI